MHLTTEEPTGNASADFVINANVNAALDGLTIENGNPSSAGPGGIPNSGFITLTNCIITQNHGNGGAGFGNAAGATAVLTNCSVTQNVDMGGAGGIDNGGRLILVNCAVSGNTSSGSDAGMFN